MDNKIVDINFYIYTIVLVNKFTFSQPVTVLLSEVQILQLHQAYLFGRYIILIKFKAVEERIACNTDCIQFLKYERCKRFNGKPQMQ